MTTLELVPRPGLRLMRVRADVSDPGQLGLGGATVLIHGRLSGVSGAARRTSALLGPAIIRFQNRCEYRQVPAEMNDATVGWIAGSLHLFADSELEQPA